MEDRFKFKAYFQFEKEKEYKVITFYLGDNIPKIPYFGENNCDGRAGTWNLIKIVQSTGLKDNNGNLIYEGYICRLRGNIYEVIFDKGYFCLYRRDTFYELIFMINKKAEFIGNKYENPELLKE